MAEQVDEWTGSTHTRAAKMRRVEGGGIGAHGTREQPLPALV